MSTDIKPTTTTNFDKYAVVLLDVAGTTTSISFVKETLFPFAVSHGEEFLKVSWEDPIIKEAADSLKEKDGTVDIPTVVELLKTLSESNCNSKGFKTLQGLIYKKGYEDGTLKSHVFPDVSVALENWSKGAQIAIYSTGSVESQKLLFKHTTEGDLSRHISHYFDTDVGSKVESESYVKISEQLKVKPDEIVFISDDLDEIKAAKDAGLEAILIKREVIESSVEGVQKDIRTISSFTDLPMENNAKRKNVDGDTFEAPPLKVPKTEDEIKVAVVEEKIIEKKEESEAMEVDEGSESIKETIAVEIGESNTITVEETNGEKVPTVEETEPKLMETESDKTETIEKVVVENDVGKLEIPVENEMANEATEESETIETAKEALEEETTDQTEQITEVANEVKETPVEPDQSADQIVDLKENAKEEMDGKCDSTENKEVYKKVEEKNNTAASDTTNDNEATTIDSDKKDENKSEKENKVQESELANGSGNSDTSETVGNAETTNGSVEAAVKNGDINNGQENGVESIIEEKSEGSEIKVKKIEENNEATAVSVEV